MPRGRQAGHCYIVRQLPKSREIPSPAACARIPFAPVKPRRLLALFLSLCALMQSGAQPGIQSTTQRAAPKWQNGPPVDEHYFPIAVWLQDPRNAARYKAAGINLYVGLWRGPTTNQLAQLQQSGIQV